MVCSGFVKLLGCFCLKNFCSDFVNLTLSVQVLWTLLYLFRFCEPYFICSGFVNLTLSVQLLWTLLYLFRFCEPYFICSGSVNLTFSVQVLWTLLYLFRFCEPGWLAVLVPAPLDPAPPHQEVSGSDGRDEPPSPPRGVGFPSPGVDVWCPQSVACRDRATRISLVQVSVEKIISIAN